ncbi:LD-carboxypeptidase [Prevotella sp. MA2016]|uniref:S66 peptidase family protein n=1 Tax=Prevotella sp. MA2016 TaxID=1408310 RepID=UPI0009E0188C|nr:LD-carboxypeptidase [Prevotella sp. MA2016]
MENMILPPFLKPGDKVALISPAYWVAQEAIMEAAAVVESWGLQPVIGEHTNCLNVDVYAGTANERASDLIWALEDDSIKAIICTRGGYGSIHLLNRVSQDMYRKHPKWLIGHGDVTTLLYAVAGAGVMSLHGPMAYQISAKQEPASSVLRNILFGKVPQYGLVSSSHNQCGHAEGILIGGNLSSYSAIAGSRFNLPPGKDIILFLEEVEETLHDIDRLFYMLRLQLDFERVKGIIFGSFSSIKFDLQYGSVEQMLIAHLNDLDIPIACGFPFGSNTCMPMIEGAPCVLDVTANRTLLTFNIEGEAEFVELENATPHLMR